MQRLLALVLTLCVTAVSAQTPHLTTASVVLSVIRIGLNLGSGPQEYIQVDVTATGATVEQARNEAFRTAVGQAVGTVVATQTQVHNQRLVRDEIIAYSSGFVDRYEILEQTQLSGGVRLKLRVWVAEIRLAHRLLGNSEHSQSVDGSRLGAQISTIMQQRESGDRLMSTIMQDFPDRSFVVETQSGRVQFGTDRQPVMEVPVQIRWDQRWLDSLFDTLKRTQDPAKDWQVYNAVNSVNPVLRVSAVDIQGRELVGQCYNLVMTRGQISYSYPNRLAVDYQRDRLVIDPRYRLHSSVKLPLGTNTAVIERISEIRAKIVSQKSC